MAGIYFHIPYCKQACYYCDFHFSTYRKTKPDVLQAIHNELNLRKDYLQGASIDTIYFGGGTPSLLKPEELEKIIGKIFQDHNVNPHAEITIEANPDDLNKSKILAFKDLGFNRLSIGIQSFNDRILSYLNRGHRSADSLQAIKYARMAGFGNLNTDLIYAITKDYMRVLKEDLAILTQIRPAHISTYSLTIEPKTVFGNWHEKQKIDIPSGDQTADEYEYITHMLHRHGYDHYEVSNFAQPGYISKHNSNYWKGIPYLGIGPSAHSFDGRTRQANVRNNSKYLKALADNIIPAEKEQLTLYDRINEQILTGLRTKWGVDILNIEKTYGIDFLGYNKNYIMNLVNLDLATFNNGKLQLTNKGLCIADKICSDLFLID